MKKIIKFVGILIALLLVTAFIVREAKAQTAPTTAETGFTITGLKIEKGALNNTIIIRWNSSAAGTGTVSWGFVSVPKFDSSKPNFGYNASVTDLVASTSHKVALAYQPGFTYYLRPSVTVGTTIVYGPEVTYGIMVTKPVVKAVISTPSPKPAASVEKADDTQYESIKITPDSDSNIENDSILGKASTSNSNVATVNISPAGNKFTEFFVKFWHMLVGKR